MRGVPGARTRIAVALVLGALSTFAGAAPASAAIDPSEITVHAIDFEIEADTPGLGGGLVPCPTGTRVVSGGAFWHRVGEPPDPSLNVYLSGNAPAADHRGWFAYGIHWDDDPLRLRVVAHCAPKRDVGAYEVRSKTVSVADDAAIGRSPACPIGWRVVTGGAFWHPEGGQPAAVEGYLRSSGPTSDRRQWYASGLADGIGLAITVVVLCRPASQLSYVTAKVVVPFTADDENDGDRAECPSGTRAVAGGAEWRHPTIPQSTIGAYVDSSYASANGRRWYASGHADTAPVNLRITTFCLRL